MSWQTIWEFRTKRFCVTFDVAPEDMNPRDSFEFDEDIAAVENGDVEWFQARVAVHLLTLGGERGNIVGADYLGGCAYRTFEEFYKSHRDADPMSRNCEAMRAARGDNVFICHYFPRMIHEAVAAARKALAQLPHLRAV